MLTAAVNAELFKVITGMVTLLSAIFFFFFLMVLIVSN